MATNLNPGQVVDVALPAHVRVSTNKVDTRLRMTAMIVTFDASGRHRSDRGTAEDLNPFTAKAELQLQPMEPGHKQMLLVVATSVGQEVPLSRLPQITINVEDGAQLITWDPLPSSNKVTLLLETYRRGDSYRLRSIDQGYVDGWRAFSEKTGCSWDLTDILAQTLEDSKKPRSKISDHRIRQADSDAVIEDKSLEARRLVGVVEDLEGQISVLRYRYSSMKATYDRLEEEVKGLKEAPDWLKYADAGIYKPSFGYDDSEQYKEAIRKAKADQKKMAADGKAVVARHKWTVEGDAKAGSDMMKRQSKLTLRAFNGEADAAISGAKWNNRETMEERILKAAHSINTANEGLGIEITKAYVQLKINELRLAHECRDKVRQEREAASELKREQREQEKLEREVRAAEREELKFQMMLQRAREEAERGNSTQALQDRIARLEMDLAEAAAQSERAKAMAELTKSGFIYVISNVGSFGEGVVKIGMTRRLEPLERIKELSSASVPFGFDTHVLFYHDKASELEAELHRTFSDRRINTANPKKEFFRCSVSEVEEAVRRVMPNVTFTRDPEAREWRETVARRRDRLSIENSFPGHL